jgi:hypothetical protein
MPTTLTVLRRGQRFVMAGRAYRVEYVNASRAHCVAKVTTSVTLRGHTFQATKRIAIDISPNSAVDLLADIGARPMSAKRQRIERRANDG